MANIPYLTESLKDKLYRYISYNTQADPDATTTPSNPTEAALGSALKTELEAYGLTTSIATANGGYYVMGSLPSNINDMSKWENTPDIGFIAALDTSYNWPYSSETTLINSIETLHFDYGIDLRSKALSDAEYQNWILKGIVASKSPHYCSLGLKSKTAITVIMGMLQYFANHTEVPHGKISICFASGIELGKGFDTIQDQGELIERLNASGSKVYYDQLNKHTTVINSGPVVPVMELRGGFNPQMAFLIEAEGHTIIQADNYSIMEFELQFKGEKIGGQFDEEASINAIENASKIVYDILAYERLHMNDKLCFIKSLIGDYIDATMVIQIRALSELEMKNRISLLQTIVYGSSGYNKDYVMLSYTPKYINAKSKIPDSQIRLAAEATQQQFGRASTSTVCKNGYSAATLSRLGIPTVILSSGGYNYYTDRECVPIPILDDVANVLVNIITKAFEQCDTLIYDFPFQVSIPNDKKIYTKSLLHFDTEFNTTNGPEDEAMDLNNYTVLTPTGLFNTSNKKFGAGALEALHDSDTTTTAAIIQNVVLGNQTFTIDFWFRATGMRDLSIFTHQDGVIQVYNDEVYFNNEYVKVRHLIEDLSNNAWHHIAYVYEHAPQHAPQSMLTFYVDGHRKAQILSKLTTTVNSNLRLLVKGKTDNYAQYIDEFRLTIGKALWSSENTSFTVPTSAYSIV